MRRLRRLLLPALYLLIGIIGVLAMPHVAEATHCTSSPISQTHIAFGQSSHCGYFSNYYEPFGLDVYDGGFNNPFGTGVYVNTAAELKSVVLNGLVSGNNHYQTSSEFILNTMLNYNAGTPRGQWSRMCGAITCRQEWINRINMMSTSCNPGVSCSGPNGSIDWHYSKTLTCGTINTYYQDTRDDVGPFIMSSTNGSCPSVEDHIAFFNKAGTLVYLIRRECANPIGDYAGLPRADFTINISGTALTPTVVAGGTGSIRVGVDNIGPSGAPAGQLRLYDPAYVGTPGTQTALTGGYESAHGYSLTHWYWTTDPLPAPMATSTATVTFPIAANAPLGPLTFTVWYDPADETGATKTMTVTINVVSLRYPSIAAQNGDTHAGGGLGPNCAAATGAVVGSTGGQSYTDYVVSATAFPGISSFSSNGTTGADQLRLGNTGGYKTICRPDIYKAAFDYRNDGGLGYITRGPGTYDVGVDFGANEIIYIDGDATLHGTVFNKMAIIVTGNVTFSGPIGLTNNFFADPHTVPSLGIIASGNIDIPANVALINAYLFANGTIDTCSDGRVDRSNCYNNLRVNGFLMANDIAFRRTGTFNASSQNGGSQIISEQIVLIPQIYLNPPKFFDTTADDRQLEGQGERQPLF